MQTGKYSVALVTKKGEKLKGGNLKVTSKTKDELTLPFRTECFAVGDPTDMTNGPLSVVANVKQGNMPVMNANVT